MSAWPDSEDSAFGSSDPTPTHKSRYGAAVLEFNDDPFKDANHRYGDPFEIEGADPFTNESADPFTAPVESAFGRSHQQQQTADFFATTKPSQNDPFASNWDSFDQKASPAASSAWGGSKNNLDDSFDPFSAKNNLSKSNEDPFGASSSNWDPFNVPVVVSRSKTSSDAFADFRPALPPPNKSLQKSETSHSLSRPWASPDSSTSISRTRPPSKNVDLHNDSAESLKKSKNNFKIPSLKGPFKKKDKNVIKNDLGSAPSPVEDNHIKMASEASRRAERDRLERLRIQEEKDLAYAIALSKAEAASLNNQ